MCFCKPLYEPESSAGLLTYVNGPGILLWSTAFVDARHRENLTLSLKPTILSRFHLDTIHRQTARPILSNKFKGFLGYFSRPTIDNLAIDKSLTFWHLRLQAVLLFVRGISQSVIAPFLLEHVAHCAQGSHMSVAVPAGIARSETQFRFHYVRTPTCAVVLCRAFIRSSRRVGGYAEILWQ